MKKTILFLLISCSVLSAQKPVPAPEQTGSVLILGGTIHIGNGKVITNGAIGFEKGKITLVSEATLIKINSDSFSQIIDASGKDIYPGFILPASQIGLKEIEAVRATLDENEVGSYNPNVRSLVAYNTDSKIIPTMKFNGILLAQTAPEGNLIRGTSSIVQLDAWNWEDAVYKEDDAIHLSWPSAYSRKWNEGVIVTEKDKKYVELINDLKTFFDDAKAYSEIQDQKNKDLRFESMRDLFTGEQKLFIYADNAQEIQNAIEFAKKYEIKNIVLAGGADSWMLTDYLKENNIPIIINSLQTLPSAGHDDIAIRFKLPKLLRDAGIKFGFGGLGMELMEKRNLMFDAGMSVAHGLNYEDAVMALTLNTAEILGIANSVGSIEKGKDATFFISIGDALDMRTNNIEYAFIQGRQIDLNTEQKELYIRYSKKYSIE
ncbi:MAG: amidohydrolase family protein [Melioribacteraceae bacterium]|nr:amidohydrolase family protein [Melioribacteraceae bacterium]MCF8265087.1 amidohydrolase family protein [Melioribacteraceae bacterium]